jgi:uncharacterized protein (DUF433 family)
MILRVITQWNQPASLLREASLAIDGDQGQFLAKGNGRGDTAMKLDRVTSNPARMNGQPSVRDLRLTVRRVVELVAIYPDRQELHREFPALDEEDIRQALEFAAASLDDRVIELAGPHETAA